MASKPFSAKPLSAKPARPPIRRSPTPGASQASGDKMRPPALDKMRSHALDDVRPLALEAVDAALEKKAERPTLLDVRQLSSYADYVLVLSGDNERQLDAFARSIEDRLRAKGKRVRGIEAGAGESSWVLMDYGDLVIHVFLREARDFYDLEGLWSDAPRVPLTSASSGLPNR